jgi:predicted MFS family arabinose efflux permease
MTYLPALVEKRHLIEGNSKLATSDSLASVVGPSFGGWLVQLVTAPTAILIDVLSFLVSSAFLYRIRESCPRQKPVRERPSFRSELMEGLRALLAHRALRDCAVATAILNFFGSIQLAVYMLFLANDLSFDPATIGGIYAVFGIGSVAGAALAERIGRRLGTGMTLIGATVVAGCVALMVPLAHWLPSSALLLLVVSQGLFGVAILVFNVNVLTFRQAVTPERVLGRVTATTRSITWGVMPVGALVGGAFGEMFGLAPTLVICALGGLLAPVWLLFSPVRGLRSAGPVADPAEVRSELVGT